MPPSIPPALRHSIVSMAAEAHSLGDKGPADSVVNSSGLVSDQLLLMDEQCMLNSVNKGLELFGVQKAL